VANDQLDAAFSPSKAVPRTRFINVGSIVSPNTEWIFSSAPAAPGGGRLAQPQRHFLVFPDLHLSEFSTYFGIFSISAICTFVP
jgi:hypothetical protein